VLAGAAGCSNDQPTSPDGVTLAPKGPASKVLSGTIVVKPSAMNGWAFVDDNGNGGSGSMVAGPGSPPAGSGSAQLGVSATNQGYILAAPLFSGTRFSDITTLSYSTYRQSADAGNNLAIALTFNVDYDLNDLATGFAGRIVFEPYEGLGGNVTAGNWQTWDAKAGNWWGSRTTVSVNNVIVPNPCQQATPCTWTQLLTYFPNIGVNTTAGAVVLKAGSGWASFVGNVDKLTIGVSGTDVTFDFEAETQCTTTCYVNDATGNDLAGGDTPGTAKKTIGAATAQVSAGGTVNVAAGTYHESLTLGTAMTLHGAGAATTTITKPIAASGSTIAVASSGIIIEGFTITRDGNAVATWNTVSSGAGVSVAGIGNSAELRNNTFVGNRSAIDVNNSTGNNIHDNVITNNRTGLIFRNVTDNTTVTMNQITDNWTVGIVFLDASGGTNVPVQSALASHFNRNNITGNWYGGVVDRQSGGVIPAPGTNLKNFSCNWWGTGSPSTTTANSSEPGYAAQIPVIYGGSATNPGGSFDIAGPASANITFAPWLVSSDLNGDCNGGSARGFKSSALGDLLGVGTTGIKDTDKRLADAIAKVQSSLDRPNWTDDNRIDGKQAEKIFTDERAAVNSLMGIKGTMPAGAQQAIMDLLAADRIIAQVAISDAVGGDPKKLAAAAEEMNKAQDAINKGDFNVAIDHFMNAWKKANGA